VNRFDSSSLTSPQLP